MKEKPEKLSLLAFEFWNNIGDEEIKIVTGKQFSKEKFSNFIYGNQNSLIEIILLNIGKINPDDDLEEWNLSKASSYLLRIIVQLTGVEVLDKLLIIIRGKIIINNTN